MKFLYSFITILIITMILNSCESNTYSEIEKQTVNTNPTYQKDIKPIIESSCIDCHNNGSGIGGFSLLNYEDVKDVTDSGNLIFRIETATGIKSMPLNGPKLSKSNIDLIKLWKANRYPN